VQDQTELPLKGNRGDRRRHKINFLAYISPLLYYTELHFLNKSFSKGMVNSKSYIIQKVWVSTFFQVSYARKNQFI